MWRRLQEHVLADNPILKRFRELRSRNEAALITYLTGGDPEFESFQTNATALIEAGADMLEVGIPFSDPIADGPVIQASSGRALSNGSTPLKVLDSVKELSAQHDKLPFVILTYFNPVLTIGVERFLSRCKDSGVGGLVVPDLPVEEAQNLHAMALKYGLDIVHQVAPNTSQRRIQLIIEKTTGFLYLVSLYGVTGSRKTLSPQAQDMISRVKELSQGRVPVAVGFGISTPEHVASVVGSGADGVIVGSALVEIVAQHKDRPSEAEDQLKVIVAELKKATGKDRKPQDH